VRTRSRRRAVLMEQQVENQEEEGEKLAHTTIVAGYWSWRLADLIFFFLTGGVFIFEMTIPID
jgi:hypothetical protein